MVKKLFSPINLLLCGIFSQPALADDFFEMRQNLVAEIERHVIATSSYLNKKQLDPRILDAIGTVPRHEFVPDDQRNQAYENRPLAIGYGQTISQPYIVAIMTDLMNVTAESTVLELGTGSGYQAAILSPLVKQVYSMEIIKPLANQARERLARLGYDNVSVTIGDGYYGWEQHAPFDAIIVTAAGSHIPPPLLQQLKPGGRMVIPVGSRFMTQQLLLVNKLADGSVVNEQILPVRFVPLTGDH